MSDDKTMSTQQRTISSSFLLSAITIKTILKMTICDSLMIDCTSTGFIRPCKCLKGKKSTNKENVLFIILPLHRKR